MEQESLLSDVEFNPVLASAGQRFVNYLIDIIIFDIIIAVIKNIFAIGTALIYTPNVYTNFFLNLFISYLCIVVLYFLSELGFKGRTIGKFVTNTKAINEDGSEMNAKTILIRSLCRIVPFEPFSAFGGHPWHDKWSKTFVIDLKKTGMSGLSV